MPQKKVTIFLDQTLPSIIWKSGIRPTITSLIVCPEGGVMLVQPSKSDTNGWIFPQGEINRHESPLEASFREIEEELSFKKGLFIKNRSRLLGCQVVKTGRGEKKFFVPVFHEMCGWETPRLNRENLDWHTANGPNDLWSKTADCSVGKKEFMKKVLIEALEKGLLCTNRWRLERAEPMIRYA